MIVWNKAGFSSSGRHRTCIKTVSTGNCSYTHSQQSCEAEEKEYAFPLTTTMKYFLYNLTNSESTGECSYNFN